MKKLFLFILEVSKPYRKYIYGIIFAVSLVAIDKNAKPYLIKMLIDDITADNYSSIWYIVLVFLAMQLMLIKDRKSVV